VEQTCDSNTWGGNTLVAVGEDGLLGVESTKPDRGHPVRQRAQHTRSSADVSLFALRAHADRMSAIRAAVRQRRGLPVIHTCACERFQLSLLLVTLPIHVALGQASAGREKDLFVGQPLTVGEEHFDVG
jgi:hypothetical protein